ncbi:MAG: DUF6883 domain-containing protein [Bryobacteraceae bacterium]
MAAGDVRRRHAGAGGIEVGEVPAGGGIDPALMEFTALRNADHAIVDLAKLCDYCLSPEHPDGKHKPRVFKSAFGLGRVDGEWLRERILEAVTTRPALLISTTPFGVL